MIWLTTTLSQCFTPVAMGPAVHAALGKPLRRAVPLTQLALLGALACLPPERRHLPTALLWQSTHGPRLESLPLLDKASGGAEPKPDAFLTTQPTIAAAQIQSFLPGLQSASHLSLDNQGSAHWSLLLSLAIGWLDACRYAQILCAQLDQTADAATGHWLALSREPLDNSPARLHLVAGTSSNCLPDTADFPAQLDAWLTQDDGQTLSLHAPIAMSLTVEFARL